MSTGLNCVFIEPKPGTWYYVLEHGFAPKNAWDWREYASCYGPFSSEDAAIEHLSDNHANPGGWGTVANSRYKSDPIYEKLIAGARRRA